MKSPYKLIIFLVLSMMLVAPAQASIINDLDNAIGNTITKISQAARGLSLANVGSITVRCNSGATCAQEGENWIISMTSMSNAQTVDLELQPGIKSISGNAELTTGASVIIEVTEKAPIQTVPVTLNTNNRYTLRNGFLGVMNSYTANAYERASISSTITTNYDIVLKTADTVTAPLSKSYDYRYPQAITLRDNLGNTATISPTHQVSGGIVTDVASVFFVDNGYGTVEAFDKVNFKYYLDKVNNEVQWFTVNPQSWAAFLDRMKTSGLQQFTDLPLTRTGNNIIMTYPVGSIGTQLQAVVPKAMAKTVTVLQNWGEPVINSVTLSPQNLIKGQGLATVTVKVTNKGSADTINVNIPESNGATVTAITNSMRLAKDQQGTFTFMLNPTVSSNSNIPIKAIATAGGSGIWVEETVYLSVTVPTTTTPSTTQKVIVKTYTPEGAILSTAPIFKNGQQVGSGSFEGLLPLGTYVFTTDNISNPQYYAPTQHEVKLSGGEPQTIALTFSTTPIQDTLDLTWVFWGVLGIIVAYIAFKAGFLAFLLKNPAYVILVIFMIFVLYMIYQILLMIYGIGEAVNTATANPWLPWNW